MISALANRSTVVLPWDGIDTADGWRETGDLRVSYSWGSLEIESVHDESGADILALLTNETLYAVESAVIERVG